MAKSLEYDVPSAPFPGAREEWDDLLETLHRTGVLRTLNGFFGQLGPVSDVVLTELKQEPARNALGALLGLAQLATHLPADDVERAVSGATQGEQRARHLRNPPGLVALWRLFRSADTRRALAAMLMVLNGIGRAMRKPVPGQPKE